MCVSFHVFDILLSSYLKMFHVFGWFGRESMISYTCWTLEREGIRGKVSGQGVPIEYRTEEYVIYLKRTWTWNIFTWVCDWRVKTDRRKRVVTNTLSKENNGHQHQTDMSNEMLQGNILVWVQKKLTPFELT